jgi:phosphoglycolate phosphatase
MRYQVVLFDLDGTLLDTLDDLHAAVNFVLEKYRLPIRTRDEVRAFIGNGIVKLMERSVGAGMRSMVNLDDVVTDFKAYYGAHCQEKTKPYDGVMELLANLKKAGVKVGVVSNKAHFATAQLCEYYFGDLVDVAIGENEAGGVRKKPAPDSVFAAIEAVGGVNPSRVVYVGDSEVDIQTAMNAGVDCVSVCWGMKDREFLVENGASVLIDTVEALADVL